MPGIALGTERERERDTRKPKLKALKQDLDLGEHGVVPMGCPMAIDLRADLKEIPWGVVFRGSSLQKLRFEANGAWT